MSRTSSTRSDTSKRIKHDLQRGQPKSSPSVSSEAAVYGIRREHSPVKRPLAVSDSASPRSKRMRVGVIQRLNKEGHFEPIESQNQQDLLRHEAAGGSAVDRDSASPDLSNGLQPDEFPEGNQSDQSTLRTSRPSSHSATSPDKALSRDEAHSSVILQRSISRNVSGGPSRIATPHASGSKGQQIDSHAAGLSSASRLNGPLLTEKEVKSRRASASTFENRNGSPLRRSSDDDATWRIRKRAEKRALREAESRRAGIEAQKMAEESEVTKLEEPFSTTVS